MFSRLLIANRGEIACRVIRSAQALGITTVAVYSDADEDALHVSAADQAIHIGAPAPASSYLNQQRVLDAAVQTGADAIHPGYGFLSENAEFAAACEERGITFVGPSPMAIRLMGDKAGAKTLMATAGVPVVPGYQGDDQTESALRAAAADLGYPLMIKASAGGGGKGMRVVSGPDELSEQVASAAREAAKAFSDDRLILERYLQQPRHIEVQILADAAGNCLHLGERDCSVQRRHQKVLEESPAPNLDPTLRDKLLQAAVAAAEAIDYVGAGTVEFIVEGSAFYFMEMNTRLQVEHPVTEMVTGLDLVEWQLRIASGEALAMAQEAVRIDGHAVEVRLYAEDPARDYLPATGTLTHLHLPTNADVRVDSGVAAGDQISVFYDPMIAKVIARGPDRDAAMDALGRALQDSQILGVTTNLPLLRRVLDHPDFRAAKFTTLFLAEHPQLAAPPEASSLALPIAVAALLEAAGGVGPWGSTDGWRVNGPARTVVILGADAATHTVEVAGQETLLMTSGDQHWQVTDVRVAGRVLSAAIDGLEVRATVIVSREGCEIWYSGHSYRFELATAERSSVHGSAGHLVSPMPGQVLEVRVQAGDRVEPDQVLMVVEAMKMEHRIRAPAGGVVKAVYFRAGDQVAEGEELVQVD